MLSWFSSKKDDFPSYSLLEATPSRGIPQDLADREDSADYHARRDRVESELFANVTDESAPGFATFLKAGDGLLQLRLPELDAGCLLVFSHALRAADYAKVEAPESKFHYFCSSAEQVVSVVAEFRECARIGHVALDRCPRCNVFTALGAASLDSAVKVVQAWKISKATEIARCRLYFEYAQSAAKNGQFLVARDVALELVGHVTAEDPRVHLLLGKLAIQLQDKRLLLEAKHFLVLLKQDTAVEALQYAAKMKRMEF
jgi:hypothetical protein